VSDSWWKNEFLPVTQHDILEALIYRQWQILGADTSMANLQFEYTASGNCKITNSDYLTIWVENTRVRNYSRRNFLAHFIATVHKAGANVYRLDTNTDCMNEYASLSRDFTDLRATLAHYRSCCIARARDLTPAEFAEIDRRLRDANSYVSAPKRLPEPVEGPQEPPQDDPVEERLAEICGASSVEDPPPSEIVPADVPPEDKHALDRYRLKLTYRITPEAKLYDEFELDYGAGHVKKVYWMLRGLRAVRAGEMTAETCIKNMQEVESIFINSSGAIARSVASMTFIGGNDMQSFIDSIADASVVSRHYHSHMHRHAQRLMTICGWPNIFSSMTKTYSELYVAFVTHRAELERMARDIEVAFGISTWTIPDVTDNSNKRAMSTTIGTINRVLERYDINIRSVNQARIKENNTYHLASIRGLFRFSAAHSQFVVATMDDECFHFGPSITATTTPLH
jgi:hypothetical protein